MRVNLGIHWRLAPLVDDKRRRIEQLNSLLLFFPGMPILFYGDETGMGNNIDLDDRNGVRTPMQWNADRNAGFCTANPARLYSPVIMDPLWGYEAVNVEPQHGHPSLLLNWMRNVIALRKLFGVFGGGSIKFFDPTNSKILAHMRQYQDERFCASPISPASHSLSADLSEAAGAIPVEMLGYIKLPPVERAPIGLLWLAAVPCGSNFSKCTSQRR